MTKDTTNDDKDLLENFSESVEKRSYIVLLEMMEQNRFSIPALLFDNQLALLNNLRYC